MSYKEIDSRGNRRFSAGKKSIYKGSKIANAVIKITKKYIGHKILDAGAGDCSLIKALKIFFPQVSIAGIDLVPKCDEAEEGDITGMTYPDSSFDTIFATDVIEHLSDADLTKSLREFNRVLVKGGHLIITTRYQENLEKNMMACPFCAEKFHRFNHQQSFDLEAVDGLFNQEKWLILIKQPINFYFYKKFPVVAGILYKFKIDFFVKNKFNKKYFQPDLLIILKRK